MLTLTLLLLALHLGRKRAGPAFESISMLRDPSFVFACSPRPKGLLIFGSADGAIGDPDRLAENVIVIPRGLVQLTVIFMLLV